MFPSTWSLQCQIRSLAILASQTNAACSDDESQSAIICIGELHAVYPGGRRPSLKVRTFSDYFAAQLAQKDATDQGV
jgi:hypothetical protein